MRRMIKRIFTLIALPVCVMLLVAFSGKLSSATLTPAIQAQARSDQSSELASQGSTDAQTPANSKDSKAGEMQNMPHMDHNAKHGGTFFMALDNRHHLEGVLLPGGIFRVYLYDDHTKPLKAEQIKEASGTIQVGESEDAPKIPLGPGKKKEAMEAVLGEGIKLPVSLTLLLHLPDNPPDAKPELFSFTFTKFTDENAHDASSASMANMPGMHR